MSTAVLPTVAAHEGLIEAERVDAVVRTPGGVNDRRVVRRRGTQEQGRALELLGHSIEYLVDSRLFTADETEARNDREAVQLLMRMSRGVFAECAEVISMERRMKRGFWKMLKRVSGHDRRGR